MALDFAQCFDGGSCRCGVGDVDLDDGERLALGDAMGPILSGVGSSQSEVGDVDRNASPRMVPMRPTTPGTSWLRIETRVPWSGASISIPS